MKVDIGDYRLSIVNAILDIESVSVNTMLTAHVNKRGYANLIVRVQGIGELTIVLCLVITRAEFADIFEHSPSVLPKIREGECSLRPVIEGFEQIDASVYDFVYQGLIIVSIHFDFSFCFRNFE